MASGSKFIIPPDSKSRGRTLAEIAKDEQKQPVKQASPISRQQLLTGNVILLSIRDPGRDQGGAIAEANKKGKTLVTNLWADDDVVNRNGLNQRANAYPSWTGTMVAYEMPGVAFGKRIVYNYSSSSPIIFNVPQQFVGRKDCILCINHGFLTNGIPILQRKFTPDGILIEVSDPSLIKLIRNFNMENGWYLPDPKFGIPVGVPSNSLNPAARYSFRMPDRPYIGLVARGSLGINNEKSRVVSTCNPPNETLGVLAFE